MARNRILRRTAPDRIKQKSPNGWDFSDGFGCVSIARKDGYELYLRDSGLNLTIRDPNTMEPVNIIEVNIDYYSPHYVGAAIYVMEHAEVLTHEAQNQNL